MVAAELETFCMSMDIYLLVYRCILLYKQVHITYFESILYGNNIFVTE